MLRILLAEDVAMVRGGRPDPDGGGLENLAKRLEAIGGTLNVTSCGDGLFRVLAEVSTRADADMVARQHSTFA